MTRYEVLDRKFLWRFEGDEDKVGKMLAFVFDPDDATDLAGLLNTSMHLAAIVLDSSGEHRSRFHVSSGDLAHLAHAPVPTVADEPSGLTYLDEPWGN